MDVSQSLAIKTSLPYPLLLCACNLKRVSLAAECGCLCKGENTPGNLCPQSGVTSVALVSSLFMSLPHISYLLLSKPEPRWRTLV